MNNLDNLQSYEDVENLARFSPETFDKYCKLKLQTAEDNKRFIMEHCIRGGAKLDVCEIGSGNSKLLYSLDMDGLIKKAVGYEVSESRWKFAEKFKEWLQYESHVENRNENILESQDKEMFDVIIAADIVTQIIVNLDDTSEEKYFTWIYEHLKEGGYAFFDLCNFDRELEELQKYKEYSFWSEFPEDDPFQYGLSRCTKDANGNIIWEKMYYERKTRLFSKFKNVIKPYSEADFLQKLKSYHMSGEIFHCYKEPGDLDQGGYLVLAQISGTPD